MNFVDKTLVRLADPTTRATAFDQTALEQILTAVYDVGAMSVAGPFSPLFDDFSLGLGARDLGVVEGDWALLGSSEPTRAHFRVQGVGGGDGARIDALWRGSIVARFALTRDRIEDARSAWPTIADIDDEIIADLGSLPSDPTDLENERKNRFLAKIRAALDQPDAFDDALLAQWLVEVGASSVGDLLERFVGTVQPGSLTVTFSEPGPVQETPKPLPVAALLLIRDTPFSLADLLATTTAVRERAEALGIERPPDPTLKARTRIVVVWVLPTTTFDDADWPGANSDERRQKAGAWLASQGIGLVTTS